MPYLNTKKAYKIACRLAKENIGRADFPYIEKSKLN